MRVSAKIDYACKAILELAQQWPNKEPVQINVIGQRQNIPPKFLTQIMVSLKSLGYVESTRGKCGGYILARAPKEIKLNELLNDFDYFNKNGNTQQNTFDLIWKEINDNIRSKLSTIDFETILERQKSRDNILMFHI